MSVCLKLCCTHFFEFSSASWKKNHFFGVYSFSDTPWCSQTPQMDRCPPLIFAVQAGEKPCTRRCVSHWPKRQLKAGWLCHPMDLKTYIQIVDWWIDEKQYPRCYPMDLQSVSKGFNNKPGPAWNSQSAKGAFHGKPTATVVGQIRYTSLGTEDVWILVHFVSVRKLQVKGPAKPTVPSYANDHHLDRKRLVAAARCATWLLTVGPVMNRLWINGSYPLVN